MTGTNAVVTATFSRRMRLRLTDGALVDARIRGRRLRPVCGDRVTAEPIAREADWLITAIGPRDNALTRPNARGNVEVLAANLDLLIVVAAAMPEADWFVVDRYLCAAENMRVDAAVVFNKTDIASPGDDRELAGYRSLGYPTAACSARQGENLDAVADLVATGTSIFVGQSGVGKSSIVNALTGDGARATASLSARSGEGRHTTVNSAMLPLPRGGAVIDSPGVRDYAPALSAVADVAAGFREIRAAALHCRFANCRHLREPGCAVMAAVPDGDISERRYASYRRACNLVSGGPRSG